MEKHIIHKVYLDLTTSSIAEAHHLKENIGSFLNSEVLPLLEKQMDTIDDDMSSYAIRLDQVHVEITQNGTQLNNELKHTIVDTIKTETKEAIKTIGDAVKPTEEIIKKRKLFSKGAHQTETFIHFLKTGTNPWWSSESITKLMTPKNVKRLLETRGFITKIISIFRDHKVRNRALNQLTKASLKEICIAIVKESHTLEITEVELQQISKRPVVQQQQIWKEVLKAITYQEPIDVITLITTVKEETSLHKRREKELQKEKNKQVGNKKEAKKQEKRIENTSDSLQDPSAQTAITKETIDALIHPESSQKQIEAATIPTETSDQAAVIEGEYVQNAGLVLIHPFLTHFFSHCNLLDEQKQLKDPEHCVHLLHYIATGKTKQAESDMVFEKFLCNIPIHESINRNRTITKKQKEQVTNLLNAVNENWGALKKSSHTLLQHEFLQRLGKIEKNSNGTTIQIEGKTHDILLKKLSWGLGLIRLPWKKEFMFVNW
ncbi:contractile injection system tape measure protein [uncultured Dokdonia sp.]|uniref:contractile injection system tape measure protein n=1 Tax=uncultured Dokdonia sp. TaxID=575653 RepID=UPI00262984A2|nr:contractile injection system tape measure protein [uncultured Dokdonia sp.]